MIIFFFQDDLQSEQESMLIGKHKMIFNNYPSFLNTQIFVERIARYFLSIDIFYLGMVANRIQS